MKQKQKIAVIIGAGPAGLTAAYELLDKTDIKPVILEKAVLLVVFLRLLIIKVIG